MFELLWLCNETLSQNKYKNGDQRDGSVIKRLDALTKDLDSIPSIHTVAHNHL